MKKYRVAVITASDKASIGKREDVSGKLIEEIMKSEGYEIVSYEIISDDRIKLENAMKKICDENLADLILTTGGTGFSPRDNMPEATMNIAEKNVPGIAEAMRYESLKITKHAMLSRAVSVIRKKTLIINLPGSPKAVRENLAVILDPLVHGLNILTEIDSECAEI